MNELELDNKIRYYNLQNCRNAFVFLVLFNIIDIVATSLLIGKYGIDIEINPIMHWLIVQIDNQWIALMLAKLPFLIILWFGLWQSHDKIPTRILGNFKYILFLVTVLYLGIAAYQLSLFKYMVSI